jgi:hypothetical protein
MFLLSLWRGSAARAVSCALLVLPFTLCACDFAYPEVVVVNRTNERIFLKNVSFNGCVWAQVLGYEEATSPKRCLPGKDKIHFQKFDVETYCREQAQEGYIEGLCPCEPNPDTDSDSGLDPGLVDQRPHWFHYQTVSIKRVDYGDFHIFEITTGDMEQDFSVPGPYGH